MLLRDFIEIVKRSRRNYFPVEDAASGNYLGMVHLDDIRPYLFNPGMYDAVVLEQLLDKDAEVVHLDEDLTDVLQLMDEKHLFSLPVVSNKRFVGMISKATLLDRYRQELRVQNLPVTGSYNLNHARRFYGSAIASHLQKHPLWGGRRSCSRSISAGRWALRR